MASLRSRSLDEQESWQCGSQSAPRAVTLFARGRTRCRADRGGADVRRRDDVRTATDRMCNRRGRQCARRTLAGMRGPGVDRGPCRRPRDLDSCETRFEDRPCYSPEDWLTEFNPVAVMSHQSRVNRPWTLDIADGRAIIAAGVTTCG